MGVSNAVGVPLQAKATGKVNEESKVVLSGRGWIDGTGFLITVNALYVDPVRSLSSPRVSLTPLDSPGPPAGKGTSLGVGCEVDLGS